MRLTMEDLDTAHEAIARTKDGAGSVAGVLERYGIELDLGTDDDQDRFVKGMEDVGRDLYALMSERDENRGSVLAALIIEGLLLGLQLGRGPAQLEEAGR